MNEVIEELNELCGESMCDLLEYNIFGSRVVSIHYMRNNKEQFPDWLTQSPIWAFRMHMRYADSFYLNEKGHDAYADINSKVLYDYSFADNDIKMSDEQLDKYKYETRQVMWREAQREKTVDALYGKIPDDILNEILNFV